MKKFFQRVFVLTSTGALAGAAVAPMVKDMKKHDAQQGEPAAQVDDEKAPALIEKIADDIDTMKGGALGGGALGFGAALAFSRKRRRATPERPLTPEEEQRQMQWQMEYNERHRNFPHGSGDRERE